MESTSLTKALCLLEATAGSPEGRSLAELAAEAGLAKPTAHRLLTALTGLGYLERPASGVYRQSTAAKRFVSDAPSQRLIEAAAPSLHALHVQTRETVNLAMLRHDRVLYLEVLESTQPLRRVATRTSDPFHTTAPGRVMAAGAARRQLVRRAREAAAKASRRLRAGSVRARGQTQQIGR